MGGTLARRVDLTGDERCVTVTAELPGVAESDTDVSLVGDQLTFKGEKRSEHRDKGHAEGFSLHRTERGAFQRTITVPYRVDPARCPRNSRLAFSRFCCQSPPMRPPNSKPANSHQQANAVYGHVRRICGDRIGVLTRRPLP